MRERVRVGQSSMANDRPTDIGYLPNARRVAKTVMYGRCASAAQMKRRWRREWLSAELHRTPAARRFVTSELRDDPADAAARWRDLLRITVDQQRGWRSPSAAFDEWRAALERHSIEVFLFPLGSESCRGFSLWNDRVPVIAMQYGVARGSSDLHAVPRTRTSCDSQQLGVC